MDWIKSLGFLSYPARDGEGRAIWSKYRDSNDRGRVLFFDRGDRLDIHITDDERILAALLYAYEKWGAVKPIGPPDFVARALGIADANNIPVSLDPSLNADPVNKQKTTITPEAIKDATQMLENWQRIFYDNNDIYEGQVKNGLPHGDGTYFYAEDDSRLLIDWHFGKADGAGRQIWPDGSSQFVIYDEDELIDVGPLEPGQTPADFHAPQQINRLPALSSRPKPKFPA